MLPCRRAVCLDVPRLVEGAKEEAREYQIPVPRSVERETSAQDEGAQADPGSGPVSARPVRATYPTVFLGDGGELLLGAFDDARSRADAEIVAVAELHALAETLQRMRGGPIDGEPTTHAHRSAGTLAGPGRVWALGADERDMWTPP